MLPLFDLLGGSPEFFVAHQAGRLEVVGFALIIGVAVPLLFGGAVALAYRAAPAVGLAVHGVLLVLLGGTIAVAVLKSSPLAGMPWWGQGAVATAAGTVLLLAYHRWGPFRWVLKVGVVVPVALLGIFLLASRVSALVLPADAAEATTVSFPAGAPPVVMLVFDELPLASLVDGGGRIQRGPYPNLARFAATATWYRHATTVSPQTTWALPSLLTGSAAPAGSVPTAADHPENLFTWAAGGYALRVVEPLTDLCDVARCGRPVDGGGGERWRRLWADLRIVAGHVFMPDKVAAKLPPIDQNWGDFATLTGDVAAPFDMRARARAATADDRRNQAEDFLGLIGPPGGRPALYFGHFMLPHTPWTYLPDGRAYLPYLPVETGKVGAGGWTGDTWAVNQWYQRHLSQVEYVDRILGMVIDRLEQAGIYDDAVVVVLADHGIAIRPGIRNRRHLDPGTLPDIGAIPLFVKAPGQTVGAVDDYPALITDVMPTVADLVGVDLTWETDGVSLVDPDRPDRPTRSYVPTTDVGTAFDYPDPFEGVLELARRRLRWFGDGGALGLAPRGQAGLLGRAVADLEVAPSDGRRGASLPNPADYQDVDAGGDGLPAVVTVDLSGEDASGGEVVAVVLNGTVTAVTITYDLPDDGGVRLMALMDPGHFVDGPNRIELLLVTGTGPQRQLQHLPLGEG